METKINMDRSEYPNQYEDKFSGKDLDDELDEESGMNDVSSEEVAIDLKNALEEAGSNVPRDFVESIDGIIGDVELYFDPKKSGWQKEVVEPLIDMLKDLETSDEDEILEKEDGFRRSLKDIQNSALSLKKSKVN